MIVIHAGARTCMLSNLLLRDLKKSKLKHSSHHVEYNPAKARDLGVKAVPTILIMDGKEVVKSYVGYHQGLVKQLEEKYDGVV